ncbi:hypothetical protein KR054_010460, partial [Drosophila jambulina]
FLSGHGCFRSYLQRFGHEALGTYTCCPGNAVESAEHAIFWCERFARERAVLEAKLSSTISVENQLSWLLTDEENWQAVSAFAASVMSKFRTEERIRKHCFA